VAGREVWSVGLEHDDADFLVGGRHVPRVVELTEQLRILRVAPLGTVERDDADAVDDFVQDELHLRHGVPDSASVGPKSEWLVRANRATVADTIRPRRGRGSSPFAHAPRHRSR
jgi:hypothetical protein